MIMRIQISLWHLFGHSLRQSISGILKGHIDVDLCDAFIVFARLEVGPCLRVVALWFLQRPELHSQCCRTLCPSGCDESECSSES